MNEDAVPRTFAMAVDTAGVVVWFEGTTHMFTRGGAPNQLNYRDKLILRALLEAAIADLDKSS